MTQQQMLSVPLQEATFRLISLLERYSDQLPIVDEELNRHRQIAESLVDQTRRAELALNAWRVALAHRWNCEVAAQRAYIMVMRELSCYYEGDLAYALLLTPPRPDTAMTPVALLHDVRRLDASLELLVPRPPFAAAARARLRQSADDLAAALEQTERCETERRTVLAEQRLATQLLQRAYERTHSMLVHHLSPAELDLLPAPAAVELAA